jgi:hypothetical protein
VVVAVATSQTQAQQPLVTEFLEVVEAVAPVVAQVLILTDLLDLGLKALADLEV